MTRPRPHRPSLRPYDAAKIILVESAQNKFDSTVVRAFLDTVSLFPIGSLVRLNDGTTAQVLRANPGMHTRPVVELLYSAGTLSGQVVDLTTEPELSVVGAGPNTKSD